MTPATDSHATKQQSDTNQMALTTFMLFPKFPAEIRCAIWEWAGGDIVFRPQIFRFGITKRIIRAIDEVNDGRERDVELVLPQASPNAVAATRQFRLVSMVCHEARESLLLRLPDSFELGTGLFRCLLDRDVFMLDNDIPYFDFSEGTYTEGWTCPLYFRRNTPEALPSSDFWRTVKNIAVHDPAFFCFENPLDTFRAEVLPSLKRLYGYIPKYSLADNDSTSSLARFQCDHSTTRSTELPALEFTDGPPRQDLWELPSIVAAMAHLRAGIVGTSVATLEKCHEACRNMPDSSSESVAWRGHYLRYIEQYKSMEVGLLSDIAGNETEFALITERNVVDSLEVALQAIGKSLYDGNGVDLVDLIAKNEDNEASGANEEDNETSDLDEEEHDGI